MSMVDDKSSSSMKIKSEVSSVGSLKVKLKIPKEEVFVHHEMIIKNNTPRVCHVCDKVFGSGKALGGHMRIHVQSNNTSKDLPVSKKKKLASSIKQTLPDRIQCDETDQDQFDDDLMMEKKPVCSICGRVFPSMKSLSGHLRCHPDRAWRGIQPPDDKSGKAEQYVTSCYSFSPASSLSDAELSSWSDQDEGEQRVVDLSRSLSSGWVVTARRGRKATGVGSTSEGDSSSLEDEVLLQAAKDLMMLSCGLKSGKVKTCGEVEAPRMTTKSGVNPVSKSKGKRKIGEVKIYEEKGPHEVEKSSKKLVCYSSDDDEEDELASKVSGNDVVEVENRNVLMKKTKKKTKKKVMKLCDLDQNVTPLKHKVGAITCDKYRCDTCDKSFSTHQALGGHMSSHNKFKLYIFNSMDIEETQGSSSQGVSPGEVSETCRRRVLDFDLNEKLPSDEDEGGFVPEFNFRNSL